MTRNAADQALALLATATLAACGGASAPDAEPADLAIVGAQLIDGAGGDPVADSVILIDDGRVRAASSRDAIDVPDGTELYVEAGLTPMETLVAATAAGAGRLPPVGEADFGTLTAGMSADLIVLNADPLVDIRNTLQIDRVMLRGEWVDRDALLPSP